MATKKTVKKDEVIAPITASVVIGPRITEKAAYASEKNVYVFNVTTSANKIQIRKAIKDQFKVTPVKIAVVVSKPKAVVFRGNRGTQGISKKAYVYLKKGDTIDLS